MTKTGYIKYYLQLSKLKIMIPVSITAFTGYFIFDPHLTQGLFLTAVGVLLLAISASVLNQIQEADIDSIMKRTHDRPIPSGKITKWYASVYLSILFAGGILLIYFAGSLRAVFIGLITIVIYNGIYTPLKRKTSFAVVPGALTGALPPLIGWVAAGGGVSDKTIVFLEFLLFIGQIPHFWLLVVKYGEEYRAAGIPMLTGIFSVRQIKKLTFTWVVTSVSAALFLSFFEIIQIRMINIILVAVSGYLIWKFTGLLRDSAKETNSTSYSVLLNTYFLLIMILLIADRIIAI